MLAIAEFIRILTSEHKVIFSDALEIAKKTFAYTNHTILPEALECWNAELLKKILPNIYSILIKIHLKQREEFAELNCTSEEIAAMSSYSPNGFSMANLAVYVGKTVNGVAKLHTEILKNSLFKTAYKYYPDKFQKQDNGITQAKDGLCCVITNFSSLLDKAIGNGWRTNISELNKLNRVISDYTEDFILIKEEKKKTAFRLYKTSRRN